MRNGGGAPPPTAEVLSRCNLVSYKLEFEHQASLCQTLCDKLKALDLEGTHHSRLLSMCHSRRARSQFPLGYLAHHEGREAGSAGNEIIQV